MAMYVKTFHDALYIESDEQLTLLKKCAGCRRFVWNWAKDLNDKARANGGKIYTKAQLSAMLPKLKEEKPWLKEVSAQSLQKALDDLYLAYDAAFKRWEDNKTVKKKVKLGFPKFKKKKDSRSFRLPQDVEIVSNGIKCPKLGVLRICGGTKRFNRLKGLKVKQAIIKEDKTGKWFISLVCEVEIPELPESDKILGIDVGVSSSVTDSNGKVLNLPAKLSKYEKKIIREQRRYSRKLTAYKQRQKAANKLAKKNGTPEVRVSTKNLEKNRVKLAKAHKKVVNVRKDTHHKWSRTLINENQVIGLELLYILGMVKNRRLARASSRQSWGQLVRFLKYKALWGGRTIVQMSQWFASTKLCNKCGYKNDSLTLADRKWTCPDCGTTHNRDTNAAKNLRHNARYSLRRNKRDKDGVLVTLTTKEYSKRRQKFHLKRNSSLL